MHLRMLRLVCKCSKGSEYVMKKFFEEPIVEVNTFAVEDVITVSGENAGPSENTTERG